MTRTTGGVSYKQGIVTESKPGFARVQFEDIDGLVTDWLPVLHMKTLSDQAVWTLDAGEHVSCIMDEYMESGCILGAFYSDADVPPVSSADKFRIQFRDGGSFEYDRSNGAMTVICKGVVDMTADGDVTVKAPKVTLDTPDTICTGNLLVMKLLTYQGGMAGSGGEGATAKIQGNVEVTDGDVTADGVAVKGHHHTAQGANAPTTSAQV